MLNKHTFSHDIFLDYNDHDSCDITSNKIINDQDMRRLCKNYLGRFCNIDDLEIYYNDDNTELKNCNKWYKYPKDKRNIQFSDKAYKDINQIQYLIDPYYTKIEILNYEYDVDKPLKFVIDTGNEAASSINKNRFNNLNTVEKIATNDMIFTYNLFVDDKHKILPIKNDYKLEFSEEIDMAIHVEYPQITYKELYDKCIEYFDKSDIEIYNNNMNLMGFDIIKGSGGGIQYSFEYTNIIFKIDGIDKIFNIKCDIDNSIDVDLLLSINDINMLYKSGIDIGFNDNIIKFHDVINEYELFIKKHGTKVYKYEKYLYEKDKYNIIYKDYKIIKNKTRQYVYMCEKMKLLRFPAYRIY